MQRCTAMPAWGCLNHLCFHTFPSKPFHNPNKCLIFAAPEPAKPLNDAQPTTNREQNLPSLLEQLCRDAALLIQKKKRSATSPTHPLCITWLYTSYIYTDNKVKLSTKVNTSRWGTFKVHHHPQSTWLYTYIYTDNKVKLSVYPYMRMGIVTTASHPVFSFHCIPLFLFLPSFCHPNLTFACKSKLKSLNLHFP